MHFQNAHGLIIYDDGVALVYLCAGSEHRLADLYSAAGFIGTGIGKQSAQGILTDGIASTLTLAKLHIFIQVE